MEKFNENQCIKCGAAMDKQEVNESTKLLDGITLCQYCQKEVPTRGDTVYVTCAKKLKLLLSKQGYEVTLRTNATKFLTMLNVERGDNSADVMIFDADLYGNNGDKIKLDSVYMPEYFRDKYYPEGTYSVRLPSDLLDGYPNATSTDFFVRLSFVFAELEKDRLMNKANLEAIDNTDFLTFQLTTHLKRLDNLKRSHLQSVGEIDETVSEIWGFLAQHKPKL